MNILITGCNGQLGNEMQLLAKENPQHKYFLTDVVIPEGLDATVLDITNQKAVEKFVTDNNIDCIVNCAAFTAVDKAENEVERCNLLNNIAPGYLAQAVGERGGSMIQVSTDYVFSGYSHTPYKEQQKKHPKSEYGKTKLAGEKAVRKKCNNSMIIRTAWLYSSFGNNFVKNMIKQGKAKSELTVVFDQVGTPTYARDLAVVIMTAINKGIKRGIYHFSNEGVISWYDFTKAIHRIAGITTCKVRPIHTEEYPTPAARPHYSVLDKTKIKKTYGIEVPYWEDSLKECIEKLLLNSEFKIQNSEL